MKIVFPESVEKELAAQKENISKTGNQPVQPPQPTELSPAQIEVLNRRIQNTSSTLYTPVSPLAPEYRSKSAEIEERLQRIQQRFAALKVKEEARTAELQRQAWLKYNHLSKPTIQDFKRPLTSFFLLASGIYMTIQYSWHVLENENFVDNMESKQAKLVGELNAALINQSKVLEEYNLEKSSKKWYTLWR